MDVEFNLLFESVLEACPAGANCIEPTVSIRHVLRRLKRSKQGGAVICRDGKLVGIFTERDALKVLAGGEDLDRPIESVMTRAPVTVGPDASVGTVIRRMAAGGYRRLPIVDQEGRPLGVVQVADIVHFLVEHFPRMIYNLPPNAHPAMQQREGP